MEEEKGDCFALAHLSSDKHTQRPHARHRGALHGAPVSKRSPGGDGWARRTKGGAPSGSCEGGRRCPQRARPTPSAASGSARAGSGHAGRPAEGQGAVPHPPPRLRRPEVPGGGNRARHTPPTPRSARVAACGEEAPVTRGARRAAAAVAGTGLAAEPSSASRPPPAPGHGSRHPGRHPASSTCVPRQARSKQRRRGSTWRRTCSGAASGAGAALPPADAGSRLPRALGSATRPAPGAGRRACPEGLPQPRLCAMTSDPGGGATITAAFSSAGGGGGAAGNVPLQTEMKVSGCQG